MRTTTNQNPPGPEPTPERRTGAPAGAGFVSLPARLAPMPTLARTAVKSRVATFPAVFTQPPRTGTAAAGMTQVDGNNNRQHHERTPMNTMKTTKKLLLTALALGTATSLLVAQEDQRPPREGGRPPGGQGGPGGPGGPGGQRGPGGPGGPGGGRMMMPIVVALDANGDGEIDATEIANASAALKKLDKNGDGKLTPDEYRGQRPGGPGGPGGQGGPGGPGGQRGGNEGGGQRRRPQPE